MPTSKPIEEEEKQKDPFALYLACGSVFPDGDGDTLSNLCLKAKPDHQTQVRTVFAENPNPGFAIIDAIGGGLSWPNLRALLSVESTRDILFAVLCPNEKQQAALKENESWIAEVKDLFKVSLGLSLKTKGKTWSSIADELWRYLLFSEFIFDLPEKLPDSLANVPHADNSAQPLIEDLCERLRNDQRSQIAYIHHAEIIETELDMEQACKDLSDLGKQDTFPFEERTFLSKAVVSFKNEELDEAREILFQHSNSIWAGRGESEMQWNLLRSSLALIECCQDNDRVLSDHAKSLENLIDFYVIQLREVDQKHREFEQSVSDYIWQDSQD